jgi:hypothetical protein
MLISVGSRGCGSGGALQVAALVRRNKWPARPASRGTPRPLSDFVGAQNDRADAGKR